MKTRKIGPAVRVGVAISGLAILAVINLPKPAHAQWQFLLEEGALARTLGGAVARGAAEEAGSTALRGLTGSAERRVVAGVVVEDGGRAVVRNPRVYNRELNLAPSLPPLGGDVGSMNGHVVAQGCSVVPCSSGVGSHTFNSYEAYSANSPTFGFHCATPAGVFGPGPANPIGRPCHGGMVGGPRFAGYVVE